MENQPLLNRRYKIIKQLGAGGTALVFKAQDLSLSRVVAIKVLRESLTNDAEFLNRFQQEARAAANLTHPNIVTIHDFGIDGRRYYIVMEHIEGQNLKSLIRQGAPFSLDRTLTYTIQMCAGIGYAHRAGLVHCDVKPQNMLVTPEGRLKVTDFGIARALASIHPNESNDVVWGSPQYFSPEQAAGEAPTPSSDVYSIGVVLFEMLTGRLPFQAQDPQNLALMHVRTPPPAPSMYNPEIPEAMEQIAMKVLAKEPAARYRTADQLGHILISYKEQGSTITTGQPTIDRGNLTTRRPASTTVRRPPPAREPVRSRPSSSAEAYYPDGMDWLAFVLGVIAVVAVLGLLLLWGMVWARYNGF